MDGRNQGDTLLLYSSSQVFEECGDKNASFLGGGCARFLSCQPDDGNSGGRAYMSRQKSSVRITDSPRTSLLAPHYHEF